jgi:cell surface protein SprA
VSALFNFDAEPLTQLVSKMPFGQTTAPSHVAFSAELAASRPQTNASQQAYLESFEGEGGLPIALTDPQWYFSSQPALGTSIPARFGATVFDLSRATTMAWQSNGLDADGNRVSYRIDQIDTAVSQSGTGISGPEPMLWLTLYPLSVGGQLRANTFRWTVPNVPAGRRWRSVRTVLNPSGVDISRAENLEFWAQIPIGGTQSKNPTIVFDFGDISENSVSFGPDTLILRQGALPGALDTTYHGKRIQGLDTLNSERDPFSRSFNVAINDNGLPGDVVDSLTVEYDTLPGQAPPTFSTLRFASNHDYN